MEQIFEKPLKSDMRQGVLLSRVWRAPFTHGLTDVWRRRCHEYWERVEKRFGVILSEERSAWSDDQIAGPVVASYATVLAVVPGRRVVIREQQSEELH